MRARAGTRRGTVVFVNAESWHCFDQLAAVLGRRGVRTVRVRAAPLPRSRGQRLVDRWVYAETVDLHRSGGTDRLQEILTTERILDVQVNEREYLTIPRGGRAWSLLASVDPSWSRRVHVYDKVDVARRLAAAGVCVPPMLDGTTATPEEALSRLGAPMVVKRRSGTGGAEVRVVADARGARIAINELGGDATQIFYQQHLRGEVLGYASVVGDDGPTQELTAIERKASSDPLGPTAQAEATTDTALRAAGRCAQAVLGTRGFFSAEFLRMPDGRAACIDVSARVWGNFLSWTATGLDLTEGYLYALGVTTTAPAARTPRTEEPVRVFPIALRDAFASDTWPTALRAAWSDSARYARVTGVRYCVLAIAPLLGERVRARRRRSAPYR